MRLISLNTGGRFSLKKFSSNDVPRYAILSHTWESDDQEVTFQDLMNDTGHEKAEYCEKSGYRKIQFCAEQANTDNLEYFWVDSCCIDQKNAVELSEAINSMFRWYGGAAKCYAYL